MRRWYCVQTHPAQENRAVFELQRQGFETYLPVGFKAVRHPSGRPVEVEVPLFPGYLFVRFDRDADAWRPIASTRGVARLFGATPERPTPVRETQIDTVRAIEAQQRPQPAAPRLAPVAVGASVTVDAGHFAGRAGICQWSDSDRVALLMDVLGGKVSVIVPRALAKVA